MVKVYSGFFLVNGKHITWDFNPGKCVLPDGIKAGDEVEVKVIGSYADEEIEALQVEVVAGGKVYTHQPSGIPLHITLDARGVPPFEAGLRLKAFGANPVKKPHILEAKAGFFEAPPLEQ